MPPFCASPQLLINPSLQLSRILILNQLSLNFGHNDFPVSFCNENMLWFTLKPISSPDYIRLLAQGGNSSFRNSSLLLLSNASKSLQFVYYVKIINMCRKRTLGGIQWHHKYSNQKKFGWEILFLELIISFLCKAHCPDTPSPQALYFLSWNL